MSYLLDGHRSPVGPSMQSRCKGVAWRRGRAGARTCAPFIQKVEADPGKASALSTTHALQSLPARVTTRPIVRDSRGLEAAGLADAHHERALAQALRVRRGQEAARRLVERLVPPGERAGGEAGPPA